MMLLMTVDGEHLVISSLSLNARRLEEHCLLWISSGIIANLHVYLLLSCVHNQVYYLYCLLSELSGIKKRDETREVSKLLRGK